jgi:hypothetical protein
VPRPSSARGVSKKTHLFSGKRNTWTWVNGSFERADESSARQEAMTVGRSKDVLQVVSFIEYISYYREGVSKEK